MQTFKKDYKTITLVFSILLNLTFIFMLTTKPSEQIDLSVQTEPPVIFVEKEVEPLPIETVVAPVVVLTEREQIDIYIEEVSAKYGIDKYLIHAVIWRESRYQPDARNGNCLGLMQVCTTWHSGRADKLGVEDFLDPYGSILLGTDYISELMIKYNDVGLVLMLYNMNHKEAFALHAKGELSSYAKSVLERVEEIKQGVN